MTEENQMTDNETTVEETGGEELVEEIGGEEEPVVDETGGEEEPVVDETGGEEPVVENTAAELILAREVIAGFKTNEDYIASLETRITAIEKRIGIK